MSQQNPLELAKQGNPNAIAALINRNLNPKGITAKVSRKDDCLRVMLESNEVPSQDDLIEFIRNGILKLGIAEINTLQVFGRQIGDEVPAWSQTINLKMPQPLYSASQQPTSELQNSRLQHIQSSISPTQNNSSSVAQSNDSISSSGIDAASPVLLLVGCFLISLFLLAKLIVIYFFQTDPLTARVSSSILCNLNADQLINPALPIFTALLALGPALLASEKGRNPLNWWCYGFLLFIVAIIHAAVIPAIPERV